MITFAGCSKTSYILKQGQGQLALEWNARANDDVLKDKNVQKKIKEKIRQIISYKKFFYSYFDREETGIYEQTTFLKEEAVSYLVIAAPFDRVAPIKVSFPIVGEFPYLGFFSLADAKAYELEQKKLGHDTYLRPVYAYSTLNQWIFDDNILSSFFHMDEKNLAELIFHELIHTVFFVPSEVDFNESLAQYFGERLVEQYFNFTVEDKKLLENKKIQKHDYAQMLSQFARDMNDIYSEKKYTSLEAKELFKSYFQNKMKPRLVAFCQQYKISECQLLEHEWNNARLAAFLTYQKEQSVIADIHQKYKFSLKELLLYFEKEYKKFQEINNPNIRSFKTYIKTKEKF